MTVVGLDRGNDGADPLDRLLGDRRLNRLLSIIGRIGICFLFLQAGYYHLTFGADHTVAEMTARGIPMPRVLNAVAMLTSMALALALLFNVKPRWAALGLACYTVIVSTVMFTPWAANLAPETKVYFMKDMAVFGSLLCLSCALTPSRAG